MAASLDGAAAYMSNAAAPVTGYPCSVGCWGLFTTAGTTAVLFALTDTGTSNNYLMLLKDTTNKIGVLASVSAGNSSAAVATADATGGWFFALGRFISATNRRISVLHAGGLIEHAQSTVSRAPSGIDMASIGAGNVSTGPASFWPGLIGETWYTNTDVQPDGLQTNDEFLRQLAFHGPFSVLHVAKDLIEYHSMRGSLPHRRRPEESWFGKSGLQSWIDAGSAAAQLGTHPPLPYEYSGPMPGARMLMI